MALTATHTRSFWAQNTTVGARLAACWGARAGRDGGRVVERSPGGTAPRGGTGDVDSVQAEARHTRLGHADRREDFAGRPVTVTDDFHRRAGVCKPALPSAARPRTWLAGGHGSGNGLAAKVEDLAEQAVEDLLGIEDLDEARAGELIMTARAPWFAEAEAE